MSDQAPAAPADAPRCMGIFDSGLGGLSVLRSIRRRLPGVPLVYIADSAHAPYGEKHPEVVEARALWLTEHLLAQGAAAVVVACNTATALAIDRLRQRWPALPLVGVEPGVKPAVQRSRNRRIAVMATPGTLQSVRFRQLVERHADGCAVHLQPCGGLAGLIERADLNDPALRDLVARHCAPIRAFGADTVVLGCTHYPFVAHHIAAELGRGVQIVDTADAIAEQAARRWPADGSAYDDSILWHTTGDVARLEHAAAAWLHLTADARHVD